MTLIIDGAISWGERGEALAVDGFNLEARRSAIYEWVRQVRGGVLAGAFTVERHLSAAIIHFMLGERLAIPEVQNAFEDGLLGPLTFERRINLVMQIVPHIFEADDVARLRADLGELRALRNAMAHKPFWLHPEREAGGKVVNLVPMIMKGKTPLALTSRLTEDMNSLIGSLIERTAALALQAEKRIVQTGP